MPVKEVNKSEEIRKLKAAGVHSAGDIVAKLKGRGITVAPALVYNVLANAKAKRRGRKAKHAAARSNGNETVIDHAIVFVKSAGGMSKAKELLTKLALLQN
jgi:hypothetical protein